MVRVMGLFKAVKMAFEDVFVRIEVAYQTQQRILRLASVNARHDERFQEHQWHTYYKSERYRRFERVCDLLCILTDTRFSAPHCPYCLTQTLLPTMSASG